MGKIEKKKEGELTTSALLPRKKSKCLFVEEKKVSEKSVPDTPAKINGSSLRKV